MATVKRNNEGARAKQIEAEADALAALINPQEHSPIDLLREKVSMYLNSLDKGWEGASERDFETAEERIMTAITTYHKETLLSLVGEIEELNGYDFVSGGSKEDARAEEVANGIEAAVQIIKSHLDNV